MLLACDTTGKKNTGEHINSVHTDTARKDSVVQEMAPSDSLKAVDSAVNRADKTAVDPKGQQQ